MCIRDSRRSICGTGLGIVGQHCGNTDRQDIRALTEFARYVERTCTVPAHARRLAVDEKFGDAVMRKAGIERMVGRRIFDIDRAGDVYKRQSLRSA